MTLILFAVALAGALLAIVAVRRTRARSRLGRVDFDELAALLRHEFQTEQSERQRCAELRAKREAAADLEAKLREVRARIAVLEERQVGPGQRS